MADAAGCICAGSPPAGITSGDGIAPPPLPLAGTGAAGGVVVPEKTGRPPALEGVVGSSPACQGGGGGVLEAR